jgi:hypothetical protein
MATKDPEKRRAQTRERVRKHRAKTGAGLARLPEAPRLPDPPSRDFLIRALGVQAMQGNVPAIRLLLEEYRRDGNEDTAPIRSKLDELAAKRAARS